MNFPRASGILLHPTSLPSDQGIGDLGPAAYEFADFLAESRQTYWQVLPLGPTGWGDSPYSSFSAFAGNTLLISAAKLAEDGLFAMPGAVKPSSRKVDYGLVHDQKRLMLASAYDAFRRSESDLQSEFETFANENAEWLEDYALYRAVKASRDQRSWLEWDEPMKFRDQTAIARAVEELDDAITAEKFSQFVFFRQWSQLKAYANSIGLKIVGDLPIFVALDSADVWRHQDQFKLNPDGTPTVVSGVPPDYFSKTGQLWGNPIYDWNSMQSDGFTWWVARVRQALKTFDIVRIDHFRGFAAAWEVPGSDKTAERGEWVDAPGKELFTALRDQIGELPFWVEDLGFITPDVESLRDEFEFPGMRILQFAFGGDAGNQALPHNYVRNCVAYTGTHDNDTAVGWWDSLEAEGEVRKHCLEYLDSDGNEINWDLIRAIWSSVADTAIAPMQDMLGLDNKARMNRPSTTEGNWQWRFASEDISDELCVRLRELTELYGRADHP